MLNMDIHELFRINISPLDTLARFGLLDILKHVCTPETALKFEDHEWCNQAEIANKIHKNTLEPLLNISKCGGIATSFNNMSRGLSNFNQEARGNEVINKKKTVL